MSLEDRHVTPTPEGVSLDLVLAGLGSRFGAFVLDFVIQVGAFVVVLLAVNAVGGGGRGGSGSLLVAEGVLSATALLDFLGYFVLCEMLWSGRSVGKRAMGIRVVRPDGTSEGFWSSLLRNLGRLVDMMPGVFYLVGSIVILATPRNQRLGDLLGNTIVIRDRQAAAVLQADTPFDDPSRWMLPVGGNPQWWTGPGARGLPPELANWDVSAVSEAELALIRRFLANRDGYTVEARAQLAMQLAARVWPLVSGPVSPPHPEVLLEGVVLVKSLRG